MKKLYLSDNKQIFGVCGGLAEYFDADPAVIRIAWVILTIFTGIVPGVIGYIVAAMIMPRRTPTSNNET